MKKIFVVFDYERDGERHAVAETIRTGENLKNYIDRYNNCSICHLCESATEAHYLAVKWNEEHKRKNTIK